ncbi:hypothetical protein [uncultured Chryseobacterium sp.]|uniref:hypothetical protein n=1 Tax=uncultured Chryseobacterium sp. TaxID=259322 RepID=UPI0025FCF5B7|nr:hypothetical protein [uncultured Chryseobacterium sp.]
MQSLKQTKDGVEIEIIISTHAINNRFRIGSATDLEMILTDVNNDQYQVEVFLKEGWTQGDLQEIITVTILNCEAKVSMIKAEIKGVVSLN